MKEFWNERYKAEEFAYGTKPNEFLANKIEELEPGKILLPFEGEGRNAVFCSTQGWKVDAFDFSEAAKQKAESLAKIKNVNVNYEISDLHHYDFSENTYDAAALIFAHPPADLRHVLHQNIIKSLKPGGTLILEAFHVKQLHHNRASGGPKNEEMLYTEAMLQQDFKALQILSLKHEVIELQQGNFHKGKAEIIRLFATK